VSTNGDNTDDEITQLRLQLFHARRAHAELSEEVDALVADPGADQLKLARLKKRKLFLKDMVTQLESRLTPDLIA
jgi:hypothetical protein